MIKFTEIRTDYIDDNGVVHIDGYQSEDDNEEGIGVGYIINGEVYWRDPEYQFDPLVKEAVAEVIKEQKEEVEAKYETVIITALCKYVDRSQFEKIEGDKFNNREEIERLLETNLFGLISLSDHCTSLNDSDDDADYVCVGTSWFGYVQMLKK